jgi:hypothetical protein
MRASAFRGSMMNTKNHHEHNDSYVRNIPLWTS